jgi:hypothetical protein
VALPPGVQAAELASGVNVNCPSVAPSLSAELGSLMRLLSSQLAEAQTRSIAVVTLKEWGTCMVALLS